MGGYSHLMSNTPSGCHAPSGHHRRVLVSPHLSKKTNRYDRSMSRAAVDAGEPRNVPAAPSTREKDCMLVLHGFWSNSGGMRLWAEDSDLLVKSPSQALRSARPHPFAAPADLIAGIHPGKPATAVLLLPSLRSAPLDSPELIRLAPRPAARTDPMLLAWTVPVVDLDPTAALAAFDQPAPDVRYGASVDYLAELAVFARELVERGRVLPQLRRDTHGAAACWRPVLQGRDVVAMTSLVSAMPPVCRAEVGGHDPHELATSALDAMVDAAVRAALSPMDLLPPRRGRSKRHRAVEAWLTALTCPDGRFDAEPDELDALAEALRPWDDVGIGTVGPARATSAVRSRDRKRGDARGLVVEAGVLIAVDAGPQPAGPRRAGMERRRQPAPLAGPAAGAAADRTGPGLSDFPRARPGAAHRVPVRA